MAATRLRDGDVVASFSGRWVSWVHTVVAYTAFLGALIVGIALHYKKIVQNEHWGYPEEWFPSVSATIGDRYPERSVFQVFIAITSGPRFALVFLWYVLTARPNASLPKFVLGVGLFRTLMCGGWTYVTSTDDHDWHDIFMITYLVATLPWTLGCLALSPPHAAAVKWRKRFAGAFFGTLVPLIYFFIQHKVHHVAGAYTIYAFFEWSLVLLDVAFDACTIYDFENFEIQIKDLKGIAKGNNKMVADAVLEKQKDEQLGLTFSTFSVLGLADAVADVYNGFVFWSILTSLGVCVWYFPLWHMGISGYEVAVMSTISPVLLSIRPLRQLAIRNLRYVHLLSLVGLLAYLVKSPEYRLFAVSFAVWVSSFAWVASWYAERRDPAKLEAKITAWSLGLIASSIAKFACWTNNPIWPIMHSANGGINEIGLMLAVAAVLRSAGSNTASAGGEPVALEKRGGSGTLAGVGLGGLFFAMHSLLSDSSTMILWVWEGYPIRGPVAVPHGALTIFFMGIGLLIGLFSPEIVTSWTFFGVAGIGAALLTGRSNWTGYYGALALTSCIMAYAPVLIASATQHSPGRTFFIGFILYNFMVLFHVWVVAYAFVPGGPLVREHTDWVMTTMVLMIGCGVWSAKASSLTQSAGRTAGKSGAEAEKEEQARYKSAGGARTTAPAGRLRSYYIYVLLGLELLAASVAYVRLNNYYAYEPYHAEDKLITAGIWTIHFSLDNDMWSSERRMRDVIKELELDVVGLLESDLQRIIMGNRDTTQFLAEDLGMYVDFGPGPNKHTWGAALLSKFPIVNSTHHLLPSPVGELAPAIHATLDAYGELVDVFVFHSGQEEDPEDRRLQSEYLASLMGSIPPGRAAILLSYLVTKPLEGNYNTYVSPRSGMKDIDPSDWDRWCEYILYKNLKRTGYARVSRSTITDTEIQVGKFVVGQPDGRQGDGWGSDDEHMVKDEEDVAAGLRFPRLFRGHGVRGHRYHVFDEPRYWL